MYVVRVWFLFSGVESNLGNIITDAMVEATDGQAELAFISNGGIRSSLIKGEITGEDILNVQPFNNTIDIVCFLYKMSSCLFVTVSVLGGDDRGGHQGSA